MASSIKANQFTINGVVDTALPVIENMEAIAGAAASWVTFDIQQGLWAVVINRAGTSVKSFNDSNIIGSINVSGSGVNELYNAVQVEFPHGDLVDERDYVSIALPVSDRFPNEQDNTLVIKTDLINDSAQAEQIGLTELKQSRVDKIIEFRTDFSSLGINAGDIIDVTSLVYQWSAKLFRIISIAEEDDDEGNIVLSITALEYEDNVYDYSDINRYERSRRTGIPSKLVNQTLQTEDDKEFGANLKDLLLPVAATGLLNWLFSRNADTGVVTAQLYPADEEVDALLTAAKKPPLESGSTSNDIVTTPGGAANTVCEGTSVTLTVGHNCHTSDVACIFDIPPFQYPYTISGVTAEQITVPLEGNVTVTNGTGTLTVASVTNLATDITATIVIGGQSQTVTWKASPDFTYSVSANNSSIVEGNSVIVTLATTGLSNGATVDYEITGSATGRISTALTGNVTVNNNSATLTINTTDDGAYTGDQTFTVVFDTAYIDYCSLSTNDITITLQDNDTEPPPTPPNTTCVYTQVPVVWCGEFDGTTNQLVDISVLRYAYLPVPQAGEASFTVPATCTVSGGAISIDTTISVAASNSMGGLPYQVITAFNSVANKGLITGSSTVTVYGYDL